jgi:prophage tail gpP-like protein
MPNDDLVTLDPVSVEGSPDEQARERRLRRRFFSPNLAEVATVVVGGHRFYDWDSVWVQHRWSEDSALFKFTAAERDPAPENWNTLQIKPGDECAIYLGRKLAAAGIILTRQASYDANQHGVMLMGKGRTWWAARGSVITETMNFDDQTFEQVARKVIAPFGVGVKVIGTLDATTFKKLSVHPGETVWGFLENIARPRKIVLGSDHLGNFLLIGDHTFPTSTALIEGRNILKCQCIISIENTRSDFHLWGSTGADDSQNMAAASEQKARVSGTAPKYSPILHMAEHPVWNVAELFKRAQAEKQWSEGTSLQCSITVQGWYTSNGNLWQAGDHYLVQSRMAMLNQVLKAQTVTFTQDSNSGTLTTLDLVAPWLLNAGSDFNLKALSLDDDVLLRVGGDPMPLGDRPAAEPITEVFEPPPEELD